MTGNVFVTVGTTSFDSFIKAVLDENTLQVLKKLGYSNLTLQVGKGQEPRVSDVTGLRITWYRFKPSIQADFESADLVISHAGAGSCLEALQAGKRLLVVINESLMGNHQLELAEKLCELGHASMCVPATLPSTLLSLPSTAQNPFEIVNSIAIQKYPNLKFKFSPL
nr:EOG090X0KOU [Triops cancriformis]